ncbi:MAG: DUF6492 family protein [Luteolibacter sp.]|uniref:DUF6492 family protein n=1 Tax=Luteolibacter sp. TaxID=1962973 RepID=UPI00326717B6
MQVVSACIARDLPIYQIACASLRTHLPDPEINLITRKEDFTRFRNACGTDLVLWDENALLPGMTLKELREMPLPFFPKGAGWYFQQFLKFAFVNVSGGGDHYLIWDADTVLLRPMDFFDSSGRALYTKAKEHHLPYFKTFEQLFGCTANREFSFISQHQIIDKTILRQMLAEIETKHPESRGWAWAIMENLRGEGSNLFSEYETYGHYAKWRHPESITFRDLQWTRNGERIAGYPPKPEKLGILAESYSYAAFETFFSLKNRIKRALQKLSGKKVIEDYS